MAEDNVLNDGMTDDTKLIESLFNPVAKPVETPRTPDGKFAAKESEAVEPVEEKEEVVEDDEPTVDDLVEEADNETPEALSAELNDDTEFEVKVDGKAVKVKFKDLKENYSGEKAFEARIQKATEARQASEARALELYEIGRAQLDRLSALDRVLKTVGAPPQVDWAHLKTADPLQYAIKREEFREWQDRQAQVQSEITRVNDEQARLEADAKNRYLEDQATQLVAKLPVFSDPDKGAALMAKLTTAAETHYGYTKQEVASVLDHRALLVLSDAAKYRELVAKKAEVGKKLTAPTSTVKMMRVASSKSTAPVAQAKKQQDAIMNKARQTGSVDDIALTLLVPAKQAQARR